MVPGTRVAYFCGIPVIIRNRSTTVRFLIWGRVRVCPVNASLPFLLPPDTRFFLSIASCTGYIYIYIFTGGCRPRCCVRIPGSSLYCRAYGCAMYSAGRCLGNRRTTPPVFLIGNGCVLHPRLSVLLPNSVPGMSYYSLVFLLPCFLLVVLFCALCYCL